MVIKIIRGEKPVLRLRKRVDTTTRSSLSNRIETVSNVKMEKIQKMTLGQSNLERLEGLRRLGQPVVTRGEEREARNPDRLVALPTEEEEAIPTLRLQLLTPISNRRDRIAVQIREKTPSISSCVCPNGSRVTNTV